jgi:hypothetical protein
MRNYLLFHGSALRGGCPSEQEAPGPVAPGEREAGQRPRHERWAESRYSLTVRCTGSFGHTSRMVPLSSAAPPALLSN